MQKWATHCIVVVQFIGRTAGGFCTLESPPYLLSGFWIDDYDIFKFKKVLDKLMIIIGQNKA